MTTLLPEPDASSTPTGAPNALTLPSDDVLIARAEQRARALLVASLAQRTARETRASDRLGRLLRDDAGRDLLLDLTDQVMRIRTPRRAARRLRELTRTRVPQALGWFDRLGLTILGRIAPLAPAIADRLVQWRVGRDTAGVILPAEEPAFSRYLARRRSDGFRLNVNVLGEAILGDGEADARLTKILNQIARPDVTYVSLKISAVVANLDILAESESLKKIEQRLVRVYRAAKASTPRTFVNLDMEEYRDLELSLCAFMDTLDQPEFHDLDAGIVLQAYIPDSHDALARLCAWANARHARGGAPIKIRIVKGANLAMEMVEAEIHDWAPAPYPTKSDVDASYKRMLETALCLAHPGAVRLGIASHNLFDIAWALTIREELNAHQRIEIEMLEGMAPAQSRAVRDAASGVLLYAPVVARAEQDASIAYLSRRLDENSSPENFLRALFDITPDSPAWHEQRQRFERSVRERHTVSTESRRTQDRTADNDGAPGHITPDTRHFANAIDTDFTQRANREWITQHLTTPTIPDVALIEHATDVDHVITRARVAAENWRTTPWQHRRDILMAIADVMERERGHTIAVMAHTVGKTVREGDPEVSEAIDFTRYAAHLTHAHETLEADSVTGVIWDPYRVVVVAGPWNFPYAIPASGLVHAIAAGSAVILKPAPEAREVGALLVQHLHAAGLPEGLVQLASTPDNEVGKHLITHDDVDLVMLTGSLQTAELFHSWKPDLRLNAETSGKNALIITAAADIDQAIKDLVKSAFGHAGQKCSAASLAIIEASVYDDPTFHARLADAVTSIDVGDATSLGTMMGPLVNAPSGPLERALTTLEPGESWLVEPRRINDTTWTPGVRRDVTPGSWFHLTECFGPVLGLMRARDLDHAIALQNAPMYGLTGGIQSLDNSEIDHWLDHVQVGNAYINRHITGAIVQRQPFGGWKRSSVGTAAKPGGPDHLHAFGTWRAPVVSATAWHSAADSYDIAWRAHFAHEHDPSGLACESNVLRYRPADHVIVWLPADQTAPSHPIRSALEHASTLTGVTLEIINADASDASTRLTAALEQAALTANAGGHHDIRLRALTDLPDDLRARAHAANVRLDDAPVTPVGRLELAHWVREQAVARTQHRYGRLLTR